jgi:hypothetical protein
MKKEGKRYSYYRFISELDATRYGSGIHKCVIAAMTS